MGERRELVICERIIWSGGGNPVTYAPARNKPSVAEVCAVVRGMRDTMQAAIKAGDWEPDGACDPDMDLIYAEALLEKLDPDGGDEFAEPA